MSVLIKISILQRARGIHRTRYYNIVLNWRALTICFLLHAYIVKYLLVIIIIKQYLI